MEMVLEDFPNKNIHLTYYDRTVVYKNSPYHRKTREAPNKSDKYWYWDYTSEETWTDSYEFTDFVTDYPETELLTTFTEDTEKTTETYNTPEDTTETSIDTSTPFQLPETTEGTIAEITTEYFEGTTVDQETTHQISTEAVTIPYETTGWDFYTTEQQPVYTNPLSRIPLQFLVEGELRDNCQCQTKYIFVKCSVKMQNVKQPVVDPWSGSVSGSGGHFVVLQTQCSFPFYITIM